MRPVRLGLLAASPVYYQAGLYRRVAADPALDFTAIFASSSGVRPGARGYGRPVAFDADALGGYRSVFLRRADAAEHDGSLLALRDPDVVGAVARGRFDVLWLHGWYSATHLLAAATQLALGGRLLIREDQTLLHPRPAWKEALKVPLLRVLFARAHGLAVGTESRRWFRRYGMPEERIFHVPNCVDNAALRAAAARLGPRRRDLRAAFGIADDAGPVVLTVARLIPKKQPGLLLEAFRRVRAARRCTLLVVGSGPLEQELRAAVERERVPDVVLAGFLNQSEIPRAYAAADVFTLPSRLHETWGVAVNEAMNFALPIVASDKVGAAADLVREGENGHVVPAGDVEALAARLGELVDSAELRERMGTASLERIAPWTHDAAYAGLRAAVDAALAGAGAPASASPGAAR